MGLRGLVTEHQFVPRCYSYGAITPERAAASVQYGLRIPALALCLHVGRFLSKKRIVQALAELSGTAVAESAVPRVIIRATGIRMIKLRREVPGCLRTLTACPANSHDMQQFFGALVMLTEGRPWLTETH